MTAIKGGNSVCFICLKRFSGDQNVSQYPESTSGGDSISSCGDDVNGRNEDPDLYSRFLLLSSRYLKVAASETLMALAKQRKNATGRNVNAFCDQCKLLVGNICDLYAAFQVAKLKLIRRVDELEMVTRQSGKPVSSKLSSLLFKAIADQLNIKTVGRLQLFRKSVMLRCHWKVKASHPQVMIPREPTLCQGMFSYSETQVVLMRLIVIFAFAAVAPNNVTKKKMPEKDIFKQEDSAEEMRRPKRKAAAAANTNFKTEEESLENRQDDNTDIFLNSVADNDDDSDWSAGAASPVGHKSVDSGPESDVRSNSGSHNDSISGQRKRFRKARPQRLELGLVKVICEEDDATKLSEITDFKNMWDPSFDKSSQMLIDDGANPLCKICNKTFVSKWHRNRHLLVVHKISIVKSCIRCGFKYKTTAQLYDHRRRAHPTPLPGENLSAAAKDLHCPKCPGGRQFTTVSGLARHLIKTHKSHLTHPCKLCDHKAKSVDDLRWHISITHRGGGKYKWRPKEAIFERERKKTNISKRALQLVHAMKKSAVDEFSNVPCQVCDLKCESGPSLRKHLNMEHEHEVPHEEKTINCINCKMKFALEQTHDLHIVIAHMKLFPFVCDAERCDAHFVTSSELNKHLESVHLESATTTTTEVCQNHVETISDTFNAEDSSSMALPPTSLLPSPSPYKVKSLSYCKICNCGFVNPDNLELHQVTHSISHTDGIPRTYMCQKCDKKSTHNVVIVGHYNMAHGKKLKAYKCLECPAKFYTRTRLHTHYNEHQNYREGEKKPPPEGGKKPRRLCRQLCADCGQAFTDNCRRNKHKVVSGKYLDPLKPCGIDGCKRVFKKTHKFLRHQMEHDPANHIPCSEEGCGQKFMNRARLKWHLTSHHSRGERYPCSMCGETFMVPAIRNYHERFSHGPPQFECDICHMKIRRFGALQAHRRTHDPESVANNSSICAECGSIFKTKDGLKYHIESVHTPYDQKKLACSYCPYRTNRKPLFRTHLKTCLKNKGIPYDEEKWEKLLASVTKYTGPGRKPGRKSDWSKRKQQEKVEMKSTTEDEQNESFEEVQTLTAFLADEQQPQSQTVASSYLPHVANVTSVDFTEI